MDHLSKSDHLMFMFMQICPFLFTLSGCRRRRVWEGSLLQDNIWTSPQSNPAACNAVPPISKRCEAMLSEKNVHVYEKVAVLGHPILERTLRV